MSMIQCPNCKSMVDNSGAFCPNCGTPIAAAPETPVQPVQAQPSQPVYVAAPVPEKRGAHGCSIAGFVCGLLGLIFCWTYIGLLAIPGLILSIVGMSQKNRSKGLGIAGLILSAIAMGMLVDNAIVVSDSALCWRPSASPCSKPWKERNLL